jgi:hypothetical protein
MLAALLRVASSTTDLVMPLMVRSPVIFSLPLPADSTLVLLKVAVGNLADVEDCPRCAGAR